MASPVRLAALLVAVLVWSGLSSVQAQRLPLPTTSPLPSIPGGLSRPTSSGSSEALALDGPVDPRSYRVGPGDVFAVSVGGNAPRTSEAVVSADGRLVVPEAGVFGVAGRTLAAVQQEVGTALQRRYSNVTVGVALVTPRRFSIRVSGAVPLPGRYVVSAVERVEDALAEAAGERSPQTLARYGTPLSRQDEARWPALRNVTVTGQDGSETLVDLVRYFSTGDVRFNPPLRDGDGVFLPTFDPAREGAFVGGAVGRPGTYDLRPSDSALDLLVAATGTVTRDQVRAVRRTRVNEAGAPETTEVPLGEADRLDLRPRDQIFAIPAVLDAGQVDVVGAVLYPGTYPIRVGETTLQGLVELAGGLTPDALRRGAYLERRQRPDPSQKPEAAPPVADGSISGVIVRPDSVAPDLGRLSDLGLSGRRYLLQEAERTPRVSISLEQALSGPPVPLRAGDRLVVPYDFGAIRVFGQVARPGYVPFVPGRKAAEYVAGAGGTGPAATDTYVIEAGTGQFIEGPETVVREGDAVFVNRTPIGDDPVFETLAIQERQVDLQERQIERQDRQDRRQARFQIVQTVFSIVATAATLLLTYTVSKNGTGN